MHLLVAQRLPGTRHLDLEHIAELATLPGCAANANAGRQASPLREARARLSRAPARPAQVSGFMMCLRKAVRCLRRSW